MNAKPNILFSIYFKDAIIFTEGNKRNKGKRLNQSKKKRYNGLWEKEGIPLQSRMISKDLFC